MKIVIIGGGIAGLCCAYWLQHEHEVILLEKAPTLGGHTHTLHVTVDGQVVAIDSGFMVYNEQTYPHFTHLLQQLKIMKQPSDMSFSVSVGTGAFEYNGHNLNTLFADRRHIFAPKFYRFLLAIVRFNQRLLRQTRQQMLPAEMTIQQYIGKERLNRWLVDYYLIPIAAAIWSAPPSQILQMPMHFFANFFASHGLLNLLHRPQWYSIPQGAIHYVEAMSQAIRGQLLCQHNVSKVIRTLEGCQISCTNGAEFSADKVIIATHSDQALALLEEPSELEQQVLSQIEFHRSEVVVHTDPQLMPKRKKAWASWNYHLSGDDAPTLTYYLNQLQRLSCETDLFLTLNQSSCIAPEKILDRLYYAHPVFTQATMQAQQQWDKLNGQQHTFYCGAYWYNGFHEDGVNSALKVCRQLGVPR